MDIFGILGCLAAFVLMIVLVFKNFSPFVASMISAIFAMAVTGTNMTSALTEVFFPKVASFISGYYGIFLFGAILAKIYTDSGAAVSIANGISHLLLKENTSENKKQLIGLTIVMMMTGILGLGGIITSVAVIIAYPLALAVMDKCGIPKRFSFAALALGAYTWVCVMPFTPQVPNLVPMTYLGTTQSAGTVPGLVGAAIWAVGGITILNFLVTKAKKNGEVFAYGATDVIYDESAETPKALIALIPLVLLFVLFNVVNLNINLCLLITCVAAIVVLWKYLKKDVMKTVNTGAVNSLAPMMTVGAIVGFANVVTGTEAFQGLVDLVFNLPVSPIILVLVFCGVIAMLTGGSATGFAVSLPLLIPVLVTEMGVDPEIIHRLGAFSGTAWSLLPSSGTVLMFLPLSGLKLKDIYMPLFWVSFVIGTVSTVIVAVLFAIGL